MKSKNQTKLFFLLVLHLVALGFFCLSTSAAKAETYQECFTKCISASTTNTKDICDKKCISLDPNTKTFNGVTVNNGQPSTTTSTTSGTNYYQTHGALVDPTTGEMKYAQPTGSNSPAAVTNPGTEANNKIPGVLGPASQLVTCGRAGQDMCTLCDLIAGLNNVIRFIEHLAVGVGVLAFTIGGVMYVISAGDSGMKTKANTTMKNAIIGFVIIFAAWIIVNTVITYMGTYSDLGIHVTSWGNFNCNANLGGK